MMFWYLATPYSKWEGGLPDAFIHACRAAAVLIRHGVLVYSPIAHGHSIAVHGGVDPLLHDIWLALDAPMMQAAAGLIVIEMPGWDRSTGIALEIETFEDAGKPILILRWPVEDADAARLAQALRQLEVA